MDFLSGKIRINYIGCCIMICEVIIMKTVYLKGNLTKNSFDPTWIIFHINENKQFNQFTIGLHDNRQNTKPQCPPLHSMNIYKNKKALESCHVVQMKLIQQDFQSSKSSNSNKNNWSASCFKIGLAIDGNNLYYKSYDNLERIIGVRALTMFG